MPGCSLLTTARGYDVSARAVVRELGSELIELDDWNCCGANVIDSTSYLLSLALPARNLALAESENRELVTTCSSCYFNLFRASHLVSKDASLRDKLDQILAAAHLRYLGQRRVRHLLDVLVNDIGIKTVADRVVKKLTGLKVITYYGCQIARAHDEYDSPYLLSAVDSLIEAVGAESLHYLWKTRCCGSVLMTTERTVGLKLVTELLTATHGADCIVTVCPMCQMNLDAYQDEISVRLGARIRIPVLFITQLMGLAFGLSEKDILLEQNIVPAKGLLHRLEKAGERDYR